MNKIAVTGYSGFVGKHLVRELSKKYEIFFVGRKKVSQNFFDIERIEEIDKCLRECDAVIHLAGVSGISKRDAKDLEQVECLYETNLELTKRLLVSAVKSNVKKFLFMSSLKVHGELSENKKITEQDEHDPQDHYAKSKSEAEKALWKLKQNSELDLIVIRPPMIYGSNGGGNFNVLMRLIEKKIPLPFGRINSNRRSIVSVSNLIDFIQTCLGHNEPINDTFLVSDETSYSTKALVCEIAGSIDRKVTLIPIPVSILNFIATITFKRELISKLVDSLEVDISHAKNCLGWSPKVNIKCELNKKEIKKVDQNN